MAGHPSRPTCGRTPGRLVLILANHIGNRDILRQALEAAKESGKG